MTTKKAVKKIAPKKKAVAKKVTMSFGAAIVAAQDGLKIAREGWNGKGMFVIWIPGQKKVELKNGSPYAKVLPTRKFINIEGHFDMFTAQKNMQPGWLASQSDMAATDWSVVK